jgi:hypothetical protein
VVDERLLGSMREGRDRVEHLVNWSLGWRNHCRHGHRINRTEAEIRERVEMAVGGGSRTVYL